MRLAVLILCLVFSGAARAVIVSGGDGLGNTTGAGAGTGWNHVGAVNGASGVYLGDYGGSYWVLTAGHVGGGTFTLNDATYGAVLGSLVTLTNPDGSETDLKLFRIDGNPGLANLTLSSAPPAAGTSLTMIGYGVGREADETRWDASWNETTGLPGIYRGYKWNGVQAKRWGANTLAGTTMVTYDNGTSTAALATRFSAATGSAQATVGDSGGGVFTSTGALAGIMFSVNRVSEGQPGESSIYGTLANSMTYSADISVYRAQILEAVTASPVPEPGVLWLLGIGVLAAGWKLARKAPAAPR